MVPAFLVACKETFATARRQMRCTLEAAQSVAEMLSVPALLSRDQSRE